MRKLLTLLTGILLIALAVPAANSQSVGPVQYRVGVPQVAAGPTFIIDEDFEDSGVPGPGDWSQETATCDWDEPTTVIEGSESLQLIGSTASRCQVELSAGESDLYVFSRIRVATSIGTQSRIFSIRTTGDSELGWIEFTSDGRICVNTSAETLACSDTAMAADTDYYVWLHWLAGSGGAGRFSVGYSTDSIEPTISDTCCYDELSHSQDTEAGIIEIRSASSSNDYFFDHFLVDDEAIDPDA